MKRNIRIDGIEFEVEASDPAFQAWDKQAARLDAERKEITDKLADATKRADAADKAGTDLTAELQGRFDAQGKELAAVKADLAKANDPAHLDALVNARADLVGKARDVLGKEEKLDGLTERQIKEKVLAKLDSEIKFDGQPDAYINGVFDYSVKHAKQTVRADGAAAARAVSTPVPPVSGKVEHRDSATARAEMIKNSENAWRNPASAEA